MHLNELKYYRNSKYLIVDAKCRIMLSFVLDDGYHLFGTLRRAFLLVTPNETSFATIEETPDYLLEVFLNPL